jgi:hypothetical protein
MDLSGYDIFVLWAWQVVFITLFSIYTHFIAWVNSLDPDQPEDLHQMAQMFQMIWICTVCPHDKRHIYGGKGLNTTILPTKRKYI